MPGIFGFILKNRRAKFGDEKLLERMRSTLLHLGSYRCDSYQTSGLGFGNIAVNKTCHTSIYTDLKLPITSCIQGNILGYYDSNGQLIYIDNSNSCEVVLKLYKIYGRRVPRFLYGHFNLVIYDQIKGRVLIANDRFGLLHLYIYEDDDIVMFAPEQKAFLQYSNFANGLDAQGISDYFVYWYHLGDRTMFEKVELLPPASCIVVKGKKIERMVYWEAKYTNEIKRGNLSDAVSEGYRLFKQGLETTLQKHTKIIIPLSGGLDSRLIVAEAKKLDKRITTVTFGHRRCAEYKIAKRVCQSLELKEPYLVNIEPNWFYKYGDRLAELGESSYGSLGLCVQHGFAEEMGTDYDCFLNGIFGGHLSFGSPYYTVNDLELKYKSNERIERIIRGLNGHRYDTFLKRCCSNTLQSMISDYKKKSIVEEWERSERNSDEYVFRQDSIFLYNRIRRAMNAGDHNRFFYNEEFPFANQELYEFYLKLSPDLVLDHYLYREIYKRYHSGLASIPWQATGLDLYSTPSVFRKKVHRFRKYLRWHWGKLFPSIFEIRDYTTSNNNDFNYRKTAASQQWVEDILLGEQCLSRGYYEREGITKLLEWEKRGGSGFEEISKLVLFELWCRNFLD